MEVPAHEVLDELFHLRETAHPGAVKCQLLVDHERAGLELDAATFADKNDSPPVAGHFKTEMARGGVPRAVDRHLESAPVGRILKGSRMARRDDLANAQPASEI